MILAHIRSFRRFAISISISTDSAVPSSIVPPPSSRPSLCHDLASVRRGALPDLRRVGHPFTSPRRLLELWPIDDSLNALPALGLRPSIFDPPTLSTPWKRLVELRDAS
jgi:hypothetical protein